MKKILLMFLCLFMAVVNINAQNAADKIVGNYKVLRNGVNSKVKVFKVNDGYRAQVTWVDNLKKKDGTTLTDEKNPDKSKRNVPANEIVLIEKVKYNSKDNVWEGGRIYDPTNGKDYKVKLWFDGDKKLKLRGYIGPFFETMEWTKE